MINKLILATMTTKTHIQSVRCAIIQKAIAQNKAIVCSQVVSLINCDCRCKRSRSRQLTREKSNPRITIEIAIGLYHLPCSYDVFQGIALDVQCAPIDTSLKYSLIRQNNNFLKFIQSYFRIFFSSLLHS